MKHLLLKFPAGILLMAFCISVAAADSPFLGTRSEPHATLYLNVDQTAKQIYPVEIWAVDGKLTNREDQGVLWVKPGEYTFDVRVARSVNLANVPGLQRGIFHGQMKHQLKVRVEAGKDYYIGAKFHSAGKWKPEVWKTADSK